MKMRKRGFTLIELLAVIVILAIIALIATPMILKVIEKAKQGAALAGAQNYVSAIEEYMALTDVNSDLEKLNQGETYEDIDKLNSLLSIKGTLPDDGSVEIGKNKVESADLIINGYEITYNSGVYTVVGKVNGIRVKGISLNTESEIMSVGDTYQLVATIKPSNATDKSITWTSSDETVATVDEKGLVTAIGGGTATITATTSNGKTATVTIKIAYANGTAVYFNPETNEKCSVEDYKKNLTDNGLTTNPTGLKTGCLKWYAFNDSVDSQTVNVLLDHSLETTYIDKLQSYLDSYKSAWDSSLDDIRLIKATEIAEITGNDSFDVNDSNSWYFFDSNNQTQIASGAGTSKYAWLFDYMSDCTSYGCNVSGPTNRYYLWTGDSVGESAYRWFIENSGNLTVQYCNTVRGGGEIRPVISIERSKVF
jgi:prepilin-type N-terminal cleavage/methylation domain-containing protein